MVGSTREGRYFWLLLATVFSFGQAIGDGFYLINETGLGYYTRLITIVINSLAAVFGVRYLITKKGANVVVGIWRVLLLFHSVVLYGIFDPLSQVTMFFLMVMGFMFLEEFSETKSLLTPITAVFFVLALFLPHVEWWHLHDEEPFTKQNLLPGAITMLLLIYSHRGRRLELKELADKESERSKMLSDLMGLILHNMRSPMTTMNMELELAKLRPDKRLDREKFEATLEELVKTSTVMLKAQRQAEKGDQTIQSVLDALPPYSKLNKYVEEEAGKFTISPEEYLVLFLALENVLNNAERFAEEKIILNATLQGGRVVLRVEDDGPGMNDEQVSNYGQLQQKTATNRGKNSGLGMGIHLSIRALSLLNWNLYLDRSITKGTCVVIEQTRT